LQDLVVLGSEADMPMAIPSADELNGESEGKSISTDVSPRTPKGVGDILTSPASSNTGKVCVAIYPYYKLFPLNCDQYYCLHVPDVGCTRDLTTSSTFGY
jgi:hypothetical protein